MILGMSAFVYILKEKKMEVLIFYSKRSIWNIENIKLILIKEKSISL
jgi:hypothetical protein